VKLLRCFDKRKLEIMSARANQRQERERVRDGPTCIADRQIQSDGRG
jgi:hypothetical protein